MEEELIVPAKLSKNKFLETYLRLWNGGMRLTEREFELLKALIESKLSFEKGGVKEPFLTEILFSKNNINLIKEKLNLSDQNWTNIKLRLKAKKAILEDTNGMFINPFLIPRKKLIFKFTIDEKSTEESK